MAARKSENIEALADVVRRSASTLTADAVARLAESPVAVLSALAATASMLEHAPKTRPTSPDVTRHVDEHAVERLQGSAPTYLGADESTARLAARSVDRATDDDLMSTEEAATLLRLKGRQSIHNRLKKGHLISFEGVQRNVLIPRGQFDAHGRVLPGIAEVRGILVDGHAAWHWLNTPSPALDGDVPLEWLAGGKVDEVVAAARGYCQGDFG